MTVTLLKVVVRCVNKSWPPFVNTAVKTDMSCSNESSKNMASFIRDVTARNKLLSNILTTT